MQNIGLSYPLPVMAHVLAVIFFYFNFYIFIWLHSSTAPSGSSGEVLVKYCTISILIAMLHQAMFYHGEEQMCEICILS